MIPRRMFRSGKWMLYSFILCCGITAIFSQINILDYRLVEKTHNELYKEEFSYLNDELNRIEESYKFRFTDKTIKIMRSWNENDFYDQVFWIKQSVEDPKKKTRLEDVLVARINTNLNKYCLKNEFSSDGKYRIKASKLSPKNVYLQMKLHDSESPEFKELYLLLHDLSDHYRNIEKEEYPDYYIERVNERYEFQSYILHDSIPLINPNCKYFNRKIPPPPPGPFW